jgi:hypothetical protein
MIPFTTPVELLIVAMLLLLIVQIPPVVVGVVNERVID